MIIDKIEHLARYAAIIEDCDKLAAFFQANDVLSLTPGKYTVEGTDLVIGVFDYEGKDRETTRWETHHTHMDIHVDIQGSEGVAWIPAQHLTQSDEYVAERDVEFFLDKAEGSMVAVEPGYFCLVMPEDGHKPAIALGAGHKGRKAVIKREVL
ncbi:YhcH/YjgK/YiaL family protein [Eubacteriales bacterium OttesenSCG-928-A19]|nr:YhcH/YjgK/YiaL family protein [Eubacteriales bacterium OttesenSCG-928-A19]